jgi:hypothetical protein
MVNPCRLSLDISGDDWTPLSARAGLKADAPFLAWRNGMCGFKRCR